MVPLKGTLYFHTYCMCVSGYVQYSIFSILTRISNKISFREISRNWSKTNFVISWNKWPISRNFAFHETVISRTWSETKWYSLTKMTKKTDKIMYPKVILIVGNYRTVVSYRIKNDSNFPRPTVVYLFVLPSTVSGNWKAVSQDFRSLIFHVLNLPSRLSVSMSVSMSMNNVRFHVFVPCSCSMSVFHVHVIGNEQQYGYGHAARTMGKDSKDMHQGKGHGHAARTWTCGMDIYMDKDKQHGNRGPLTRQGHWHALGHRHTERIWTWIYSLDMDMQHDMVIQHGLGHAEFLV